MRLMLDQFQLRNPDRILIAHAHRHQLRDFTEHRGIDTGAADKPSQAVHIKLGVARTLIVDQKADAFVDQWGYAVGQILGRRRKRIVVVADEVGEQIAKRGKSACHAGDPGFYAGFRRAETGAACCASRCSNAPRFWNSRALASLRK